MVVVCLSFLVMGCAKGYKMDNSTGEATYDMVAPEEAKTTDHAVEYEQEKNGDFDSGEGKGLGSSSTINSQVNTKQDQDKIIRTFFMTVETQEFDTLISKLDQEINRLGGYVENSQISGKRYYYMNEARYGKIVARIPKDQVNEFVNVVDDNSNVVNKQESSENVTLKYVDMESRKKSLEIEQERLFALLEKTDTLESIIALESRLSDIRYELQNYESQLRTYDNQVDYSTVTLTIQEVERITPVEKVKQTVGSRIKNGFNNTMYDLSEGLKNFVVWFVVNLPYLLIWAGIILGIVLIIRKYRKKTSQKKATAQSMLYQSIQSKPDPTNQGPNK
jgi:hypothetical protein